MDRIIAISDNNSALARSDLIAENKRLRRLLKAAILGLQGLAENSERIIGTLTGELERIDQSKS